MMKDLNVAVSARRHSYLHLIELVEEWPGRVVRFRTKEEEERELALAELEEPW